MDIRRQQGIRTDHNPVEQARDRARTRPAGLPGAERPDATERPRGRDRVDVSDRLARALAELQREQGEELDRADLQKLKRLHAAGELNSPERLMQAAARLLGAE